MSDLLTLLTEGWLYYGFIVLFVSLVTVINELFYFYKIWNVVVLGPHLGKWEAERVKHYSTQTMLIFRQSEADIYFTMNDFSAPFEQTLLRVFCYKLLFCCMINSLYQPTHDSLYVEQINLHKLYVTVDLCTHVCQHDCTSISINPFLLYKFPPPRWYLKKSWHMYRGHFSNLFKWVSLFNKELYHLQTSQRVGGGRVCFCRKNQKMTTKWTK